MSHPGVVVAAELVRHRDLKGPWRAVLVLMTVLGVALAINQPFHLRLLIGVTLLENRYLYLLLGCFLSCAFLVFPASSRRNGEGVPWHDAALFLAALGCCGYFAVQAHRIVAGAWEFMPRPGRCDGSGHPRPLGGGRSTPRHPRPAPWGSGGSAHAAGAAGVPGGDYEEALSCSMVT